MEISMTYRQKAIRSDLEAWERYIDYISATKRWRDQVMLEFAMEQRKRHLKTLLKVQTEEFDRS